MTRDTLYPADSQRCLCKGTGLIPPTSEVAKGQPQAYCPTHRCKRYWPQMQADGRIQYKELGSWGLK